MEVQKVQCFQMILERSLILTKLSSVLQNCSALTIVLLCLVVLYVIIYKWKREKFVKLIDKIPGPPGLPLIGNAIEINVEHDELFSRILGMRQLWGRRQGFCKCWIGLKPYIFISKPTVVEPILSSSKHIDKSDDYEFLRPWLGTGLLTSHGKKWHTRRKILTPAFHFKILEDFIDVFQEQSAILVEKMKKEIGCESFNIFPYVTLCTLDIVCETAMGQHVHAQNNSDSDYVRAVYEIGSIVLNRQSKLWLQPNIIFRCTSLYAKHQKCLEILHGFSNRVIRERKQEIVERKMKKAEMEMNNNCLPPGTMFDENNNVIKNPEEDIEFGRKKRLAFLDLLIEASQDGQVLSNEDIREEVDTFMFEGHDTTSAAICWSLHLIGSHPEVQERIMEELDLIFGDDKKRIFTMTDLLKMKYLECCIKEALRLFPSVPLIARQITEEVNLGGYRIPAGTTAMIVTYMLHRNPEIYHKPEQFNPDRFLPENCHGRHPYAYIPFSAGPRNCIGQKFAILEEKAVLSTVLRNFKIEALDRREDLTLLGELILRPKNGLQMRITPRN